MTDPTPKSRTVDEIPPVWKEILALGLLAGGATWILYFGHRYEAIQQGLFWLIFLVGAAALIRSGWLKVFGPVLFYDLLRTARRSRFVVIRTLYAILLSLLLCWMFAVMIVDRGGTVRTSEMADFANTFFYTFIIIQWIAVVLLTPAYTAGAISEEKERKTIEYILATDLHNREIILGKMVSRLFNLTFILFAGLPILSFLQFLGGVDPVLVLGSFLATLLTMFSMAGLSILGSVQMRRTREAIVFPYLAFILYHALAFMSRIIYIPTIGLSTWPTEYWPNCPITLGDLSDFFNVGNVGYAIWKLFNSRAILLDELPNVLLAYGIFHVVVAVATMVRAVFNLRVVALREPQRRPGPKSVVPPQLTKKPGLGTYPVIWKEVFGEGNLRLNRAGRILAGVLVLASFTPTAIMIDLYLENKMAWSGPQEGVDKYTNVFQVRLVGTLIASLLLLAVTVRAANSVSGEREKDTLDGLLTTPLGAAEILLGKWIGAIFSVRWGIAWLGLIWMIGVLLGGLQWWAVPLLLTTWFLYAIVFAGIGLWFSARTGRTLRATVGALAAALFVGGAHWLATLVFVFMPLWALGLHRLDLEWLMNGLFGQTPPLVLGLFGFIGNEWEAGYQYAETTKLTISSLVGLGIWGLLIFPLWLLTLRRFRAATLRGAILEPERTIRNRVASQARVPVRSETFTSKKDLPPSSTTPADPARKT